jgi:apolipoprotein N-acyltransferase
MKRFFSRNIEREGRVSRAWTALFLFVAAGVAFCFSVWAGAILGVAALFTLIEAWRGWCVLRACGIKTKR